MEPNGQDSQHIVKPKQVTTAVYLIYASFVVGALSLIVGLVSSYQTGLEFSRALGILTCSGISYIIMIYIATRIGNGRNWARKLLLILFILGILSFICDYRNYVDNVLSAANMVITNVLQFAALILLFQQPSSAWFNSMNKQDKQEPDQSEQPMPVDPQHQPFDEAAVELSAASEKEEIAVRKLVTVAGAVGAWMGLMNAALWAITMPPQSGSEREMIYFLIAGGLALGAALGAAIGFFFLSQARQKPNRSPVRWAILGGFLGGLFSFGCCFFFMAMSFV